MTAICRFRLVTRPALGWLVLLFALAVAVLGGVQPAQASNVSTPSVPSALRADGHPSPTRVASAVATMRAAGPADGRFAGMARAARDAGEAAAAHLDHDAHAAHAAHAPHDARDAQDVGGSGPAAGASCPCHAACAAPPVLPAFVVLGGAEFLRPVEPALTPGRETAPEPRPPRG